MRDTPPQDHDENDGLHGVAGDAGGAGDGAGGQLVAHRADRVGGRADEGEAGLAHRLGDHVGPHRVVAGADRRAVRVHEPRLAVTAVEFDDVLKSGRTHLMDATPVRLGQEFGGRDHTTVMHGVRRIEELTR